MKRILIGCLAWVLAMPLVAGNGPGAVRKQVEASMLLSGTILVDEQGRVAEFAIDQADKVDGKALRFVDASIRQWLFEPTLLDGKPAMLRNRVDVRLVAERRPDGKFVMRIGGANFKPFEVEAGTEIGSGKMPPPSYPLQASLSGVEATVYLIFQVGGDGRVKDMVAEQVNLKVIGSESEMQKWRRVFVKSATLAARDWTFVPPEKGEQAGQPFWTVRVPVDYVLDHAVQPYGQWQAYVPGPLQDIPWRDWEEAPGFSPDALVAGGAQSVGGKGGLRLLTPLSGG